MLITGLVPSGARRNVALFRPAARATPGNRIAAEAAAPEVADLEVAGGFVEAEVVEEVVREVQREEERRLGRRRGVEREVEQPARAVEGAERAFGRGVAAEDVHVVARQPAGVREDRRRIAERRGEVAELVIHRRRAGAGAPQASGRAGARRSLRGCRLHDAAGAVRVEHAVAPQQQLAVLGVDEDVVELREAVGLELDVPGQPQAAVHREPHEGRRHLAKEAAAREPCGPLVSR